MMSSQSVLIPVPWETRNLGIPCFAISEGFLSHPNSPELELAIATQSSVSKRFFVQTRIPKKYYSACSILEMHRFYFVESVLSPLIPIDRNPFIKSFIQKPEDFLPTRFKLENISFEEHKTLSPEDCQLIKAVAYDSFVDDRFHLDKNCADDLANQRFTFWIDDLVTDSSTIFYLFKYKSDIVGFGAFKASIFSLMGFSRRYANSGLGDFLFLSCLQCMCKFGYTAIKTTVSVNNIPILNVIARNGGKFKCPEVTFHYWNSL